MCRVHDWFAFFVFMLFGTLIHAQGNEEFLNDPTNWVRLDQNEYIIKYPSNFLLESSEGTGSVFSLVSKRTSPFDKFRENVNLTIQPLGGRAISLEMYVDIYMRQLKKQVPNLDVIGSQQFDDDNGPYQKVIFKGRKGKFDLMWQQRYYMVDGTAYVLTLACEESKYDLYVDVGNRILNSFRIK